MVISEAPTSHLIVASNGAAALHGYEGHDIPEPDLLKACVHCGMCLSSCPTYRMTGREMSSPRGRLWMMSAVGESRLDLLDPSFDNQMYECLNCRACEAVCPSGVQYGPLVEAARAQLEQHRLRPLWQRVLRQATLGWTFADARRFRGAIATTRLYQRSGLSRLARATGILRRLGLEDAEALLPRLTSRFLVPGTERWGPDAGREPAHLFNGCVMSTVFPDTNRATGRVLARNGFSVSVPAAQQCCGALQVHSGMFDEARALARKNIDAFEAEGSPPVVVNAAGCGAALKEYGHLLKDDAAYAERAKRFSSRVKDATEVLGAVDLVPPTGVLDRTVTYQEPCHLAHAQRVTVQPRRLLAAIPGLKVVEMRESALCCGSAGIYNILRKEMADALGDRKVGHAAETKADEVITANPGCYLQLVASMRRNGHEMRVRHIVDLLDEAYQAGECVPTS